MDEDEFFGARFLDVSPDGFAAGVGAKIKGLNVATNRLWQMIWREGDGFAGLCGTQDSCGALRVGVAAKQDAVLRMGEEVAGDAVAEGFFGHHATAQCKDAAGADAKIGEIFPTDDVGRDGFHDLEAA